MKTIFATIGTIVLAGLFAVSCSTETPSSINIDQPEEELLGLSEFKSAALPAIGEFKTRVINDEDLLHTIVTRSETDELPAEVVEVFEMLTAQTVALLDANEIDYSEFEGDDDPRLAIVGLALLEMDEAATSTRTTPGGCALQALGLGGAVKSGLKKVAIKIAAKAVLKAVPYVGWAVTAGEFIYCMVSD